MLIIKRKWQDGRIEITTLYYLINSDEEEMENYVDRIQIEAMNDIRSLVLKKAPGTNGIPSASCWYTENLVEDEILKIMSELCGDNEVPNEYT